MELTIKNLKETLLQTIGQDLIDDGYAFSKSYFAFRKQQNKVKIDVQFEIYDYKPSWLSFNYIFSFSLVDEIEREYKRFLTYCKRKYFKLNLLLFEGDFHEEMKGMLSKFRMSYDHEIFEIKPDNSEIEYSRKLLKEGFLPMVGILTDKTKFTDYVLGDYDIALKNGSFFTPSLIAAKLKGVNELEKLVAHLNEKLDVYFAPPNDWDRKKLSDRIEFAKTNQ